LREVNISGKVFIGDDVYLDEDNPESVEMHDGVVIPVARSLLILEARRQTCYQKASRHCRGLFDGVRAGADSDYRRRRCDFGGLDGVTRYPALYPLRGTRVKAFGKVTVPFTIDTTYEKVRRGLEPMRPKNGKGERP